MILIKFCELYTGCCRLKNTDILFVFFSRFASRKGIKIGSTFRRSLVLNKEEIYVVPIPAPKAVVAWWPPLQLPRLLCPPQALYEDGGPLWCLFHDRYLVQYRSPKTKLKWLRKTAQHIRPNQRNTRKLISTLLVSFWSARHAMVHPYVQQSLIILYQPTCSVQVSRNRRLLC